MTVSSGAGSALPNQEVEGLVVPRVDDLRLCGGLEPPVVPLRVLVHCDFHVPAAPGTQSQDTNSCKQLGVVCLV